MKRVLAFFLMICMLVPLVPASIFAEDLQTDTQAAENSSGGKSIMEYAADSFEYGDDEKYYDYLDTVLDLADRASLEGVLTVLRLWNLGSFLKKASAKTFNFVLI